MSGIWLFPLNNYNVRLFPEFFHGPSKNERFNHVGESRRALEVAQPVRLSYLLLSVSVLVSITSPRKVNTKCRYCHNRSSVLCH